MSFKKFLKKAVKVVLPGAWEAGEGLVNAGEKAWSHISGERGAEKQNQANLKAWEMQNEYNTPANQIQRLLDAGLNPNLAYSNVDTGNAKSAPDIANVGDPVGAITGMLGHAFNAVQLMNSIQARKMQAQGQMFQEQYQKDLLDFRRHELAVSEALRTQELQYRQSRDEESRYRWQSEFDAKVADNDRRFDEMQRHNKAMEGKPTTMGMLDNVVYGMTGRHTNDVLSSAGRLEKKYVEKALLGKNSPIGGIARIHGKYF